MAEAQNTDISTSLDGTTLQTLSYLESRLLRLEHILNGHTTAPAKQPALPNLQQLELRFEKLRQRIRTYDELLKIYKAHPSLFSAPSTDALPPADLSSAAQAQMVLASSTLYPSTASSLTSIEDSPVPDPSLSASLTALRPRMRAVEAVQKAQAVEIAELRGRSERVVRQWYEQNVVGYGNFVADVEKRVEGVEKNIRQAERIRAEV